MMRRSSSAFLEEFAGAVAAAARRDQEAQALVEEYLPQFEADGWHIANLIRRIWAGERDLPALVAGLDAQDTQLTQLILARLVAPPSQPRLRFQRRPQWVASPTQHPQDQMERNR